jgi:hypothetical protein
MQMHGSCETEASMLEARLLDTSRDDAALPTGLSGHGPNGRGVVPGSRARSRFGTEVMPVLYARSP